MAESSYTRLVDSNLRADAITYTSMVHVHGNSGNCNKAFEWLNRMREANFSPPRDCFQILVNGLAKTARGDDAAVVAADEN